MIRDWWFVIHLLPFVFRLSPLVLLWAVMAWALVAQELPRVVFAGCFVVGEDAAVQQEASEAVRRQLAARKEFRLVSQEQVEQEMNFLRFKLPLSAGQLAAVAKNLEAEAAVDALVVVRGGKGAAKVKASVRWLDAEIGEAVRGGVGEGKTEAEALSVAAEQMLVAPVRRAQVQFFEQRKVIHLNARRESGFKKGMRIVIVRSDFDRNTGKFVRRKVGYAKITGFELGYAIAKPITKGLSTQNPDEAIALFTPPKEFRQYWEMSQ